MTSLPEAALEPAAPAQGEPVAGPAPPSPRELPEKWLPVWPKALAAWSAYTLLREPTFLTSKRSATQAQLAGEIAAIRLRDQTIFVNAEEVVGRGLAPHGLAILAHEIGHHIYVPGNLTDNARLVAATQRALAGLDRQAVGVAANLYADVLINDRLQRRAGIDVAAVYARLREDPAAAAPGQVWAVYTTTCEDLWRLPAGALCPVPVTDEMRADAQLLARIVRTHATDWLAGAARFATVLFPYFAKDQEDARGSGLTELGLGDIRNAGRPAPGERDADAIPDGLTEIDAAELGSLEELDETLADPLGVAHATESATGVPEHEGQGRPGAQARTPFELGQLLESLGLSLDAHEVTSRYYRERALPHLIPFPQRRGPAATEPLPEGTTPWQPGEPLETMDVFESVLTSPVLVPGVTTVQRVFGETPGSEPAPTPVDLDIYVDCSGSMPNPTVCISYLTLAATILALSALRAGAAVQATLWSSAGVFETTGGFIRDEKRVLGTVTGYVPGGTAFPVHILRDTYRDRRATDPPAHIVVISDDGADTMLARDEQGNDGAAVSAMALEKARGGGTLVLNLHDVGRWLPGKALREMGYRIHAVQVWEDLVEFARKFVRDTYGEAR